ncbi:MAG: hypothetical protein U0W40_09645 [Acidimicrobiia bacterium]
MSTNWKASVTALDAVVERRARHDGHLHERLAAHDDGELTHAVDQVVLVERREVGRARGAHHGGHEEDRERNCGDHELHRLRERHAQREEDAGQAVQHRHAAREVPVRLGGATGVPVHRGDQEDEHAERRAQPVLVVAHPRAGLQRDEGDHEHLREQQHPVDGVVAVVAVHVERGGEPDPPEAHEHAHQPEDPTRVGHVRHRGAEHEDRRHEHQVVEELEPHHDLLERVRTRLRGRPGFTRESGQRHDGERSHGRLTTGSSSPPPRRLET